MRDLVKLIKNYFKKNWQILFIILLSIIPLHLFRKNLIIAAGDFYTYLDPASLLKDDLYYWNGRIQAGLPNLNVSQIFPFLTFWWVFEKMRVSLVNIQRLWVCSYFIISGVSIYELVKYLAKKIGFKNTICISLGSLLSAVLYMINMFSVIDIVHPSLRPVQAVLPIMMFLWIKGLETKSLKYSFWLAAASLLYASSNINIATVSPIYIILFLYLIFFLLVERKNIGSTVKFAFISLFFLITINFWWLLPTILSTFNVLGGVKIAASSISFLTSSDLVEAFRFLGFWAWKAAYEGMPNFPYAQNYDKLPLVLLTYLIPAFSLIIFFRKRKKETVFLGMLVVLGLFLIKGILPPFGKIYSILFRYLPGFWIFREPYYKFTLITVFAFSCLLGLSFIFLVTELEKNKFFLTKEKLKTKKIFFVWFLIFSTILINSYPFLTGEVIWDRNYKTMRSIYAQVPDYWVDTKLWFKEKNVKNERVLILPKSPYGHAYKWKSGIGTSGPVAHVLLEEPIVFYSSSPALKSEEIINEVYASLGKERNERFLNLLSMLNIRYLLQHNDLDYENSLSGPTFSPNEVKEILANYPEISKIKTFGELDIYEVKEPYRQEKFFGAGNIIFSNIDFKDWLGDEVFPLVKNSAVFSIDAFSEDQKTKTQKLTEFTDQQLPKIIWEKQDPTEYKLKITGNDKPFILVFSESYDSRWQAFVNDDRISDTNHFLVNGYANAWLVDKEGNYDMEISYSLQKKFDFSWYVSAITLISGIVVTIFLKVLKNKKLFRKI